MEGIRSKRQKKLHDGNIEAKVNIIGFDVDDEGQNQLREAAEAGGGKYATVRDQSGFEDVLLKKWKPSRMQVWTQQGVSLRSFVDQKAELQEIYGRLSNVSDREALRISGQRVTWKRNNSSVARTHGQSWTELTK